MTPWYDLRYSLMDFIVPAMSALLTLGSMFRSLYSSLGLFCLASKLQLLHQRCISTYDGIGRQLASDVLGLWLKPAALCWVSHWHSCLLAFSWHYRCHWHCCQRNLSVSGLSSHCSLTSNLAASGLNSSCKYISWSHEAIISGPCARCTRLILSATLQFIILWHNVWAQGNSIFTFSVS